MYRESRSEDATEPTNYRENQSTHATNTPLRVSSHSCASYTTCTVRSALTISTATSLLGCKRRVSRLEMVTLLMPVIKVESLIDELTRVTDLCQSGMTLGKTPKVHCAPRPSSRFTDESFVVKTILACLYPFAYSRIRITTLRNERDVAVEVAQTPHEWFHETNRRTARK